jgi:hypothetical protein
MLLCWVPLCWMSQISPLCWVSLCLMSLCWVLLCWVSWRHFMASYEAVFAMQWNRDKLACFTKWKNQAHCQQLGIGDFHYNDKWNLILFQWWPPHILSKGTLSKHCNKLACFRKWKNMHIVNNLSCWQCPWWNETLFCLNGDHRNSLTKHNLFFNR